MRLRMVGMVVVGLALGSPLAARLAASDAVPVPVVIAALPSVPPSLPPLVIPARDPFAADVRATPAPGALQEHLRVGSIRVPDVTQLGSAAPGAPLAVLATMLGADEGYALVEEGNQVRVVGVGDSVAGSRISRIVEGAVVLANGARVALEDRPQPAAAPTQASPAVPRVPPPIPGSVVIPPPRAATAPPRLPTAGRLGISAFGTTVLTSPDGRLVASPQPSPVAPFLTPLVPLPTPLGARSPQGGPR